MYITDNVSSDGKFEPFQTHRDVKLLGKVLTQAGFDVKYVRSHCFIYEGILITTAFKKLVGDVPTALQQYKDNYIVFLFKLEDDGIKFGFLKKPDLEQVIQHRAETEAEIEVELEE